MERDAAIVRAEHSVSIVYEPAYRDARWYREVPSRPAWRTVCSECGCIGAAYQSEATAQMYGRRHASRYGSEPPSRVDVLAADVIRLTVELARLRREIEALCDGLAECGDGRTLEIEHDLRRILSGDSTEGSQPGVKS